MKLIACADIHARNKPEGALYLYRRLIRSITLKAIAEGCPFVFHAGDLIHEKHCMLVELVIMLYQEFAWAKKQGVTWVLIPGNHDMPAKHKPAQSLLYVFKAVAHVYLQPRRLKADGWSIYLNPWRFPDQFKKNSLELAKQARLDDNPFKVQLAHIGVAEGVMSPSNSYRVPSPVRILDLHTDKYTMTLLGDYHSTQKLGDRIYYMGAPIAHMHGDIPNQGVWVIDTLSRPNFRQVELEGKWPEFITRELREKEDLEIDPANHYKLRVASELAPYYELHYKGKANVKIETVADFVKPKTARRLEGVTDGDTRAILNIWLKQKGFLEPEYYDLGDEYLAKAEQMLYESRA